MQPKSHDTFVIGSDENENIVFLKGYNYKEQKDEAQLDLKWVQDNCKGWWITNLSVWTLEHEDESYKINLPTP